MTKRWVAFSREYEMNRGEQLGQNGNRYIETSSACLQQSSKQSFSRPSPLACTEALSLGQSKEQNTDHSFCSISADQGGQLGPIVMDVGGEVASISLTCRVTPAVSDPRGVESGGYALPHVHSEPCSVTDCAVPSPAAPRSFRTTGLTMPLDLPQI